MAKWSDFRKLSAKFKREGVESPDGLAAYIGREKYGEKAFERMAKAGKLKKKKGA